MNFKTIINQFLSSKYLAFTITLFLFAIFTMPNDDIPVPTLINDKAIHFIAFFGWAFCWQHAFEMPLRTILIGFAYGLLIEFWQAILPDSFHRSFDLFDSLYDCFGVLAGVILCQLKKMANL